MANFNNMTYGRDDNVREKVADQLSRYIGAVQTQLDNLGEVLDVIEQYWNGADEEQYKKKLIDKKKEISERLSSLSNGLGLSLQTDVQNFRDMQSRIEL